MFGFDVDWFSVFPPGVAGGVVVGALLPIVVISLLCVCATVVSLSANKQRGERAALVLHQLLDALRALCRCGRGGR